MTVVKGIRLRNGGGLDNLKLENWQIGQPGAGEVLVKLRASSLNFHDYVVATGLLPVDDGRVLMSDGAGEVLAVGPGVESFKPGDAVVTTFLPDWLSGHPNARSTRRVPGDTVDGYACNTAIIEQTALTMAPAGWSHAEAATLTCAGLTAWAGVVSSGQVKPGDVVLVQGSGGVSVFAMQFALAAGATVIATTSSKEKAERLRAMGAAHVINYRENPQWGEAARKWTGGRGVDNVIEIGGAGTFEQSMQACRVGGHIAMIGILAGYTAELSVPLLFTRHLRVSGITVGSRSMQQDMVRAVEANGLRPVIDRSFALADIGEAFRYQESGAHMGKICLDIPG